MGGVVVIFTASEITALRLAAWCKDIPLNSGLPSDSIGLLLRFGYLRQSRCGQSYRVTPMGYKLLEDAGYHYEPDRQYRGQGSVLTRRLQTSEVVMFFHRLGADVFLEHGPPSDGQFSFLPSFALRRKAASNVLGGSRLSGFLYAPDITYVPYYIADGNDGLYPMAEERTFRAPLLCGKNRPAVLYTGKATLEELLDAAARSRVRKAKSTTPTFMQAAKQFTCLTCFVPLSESGLRQLRVMCQPKYRERLIHALLGKQYEPVVTLQSDARHPESNTRYLIGIDCDFTRFERAAQEDGETHIILLANQLDAVQQYLRGKNAVLHPLDMEVVEQALGLPHSLPCSDLSPFRTAEGGYLHVPPIKADGKTGTKNRKGL